MLFTILFPLLMSISTDLLSSFWPNWPDSHYIFFQFRFIRISIYFGGCCVSSRFFVDKKFYSYVILFICCCCSCISKYLLIGRREKNKDLYWTQWTNIFFFKHQRFFLQMNGRNGNPVDMNILIDFFFLFDFIFHDSSSSSLFRSFYLP